MNRAIDCALAFCVAALSLKASRMPIRFIRVIYVRTLLPTESVDIDELQDTAQMGDDVLCDRYERRYYLLTKYFRFTSCIIEKLRDLSKSRETCENCGVVSAD